MTTRELARAAIGVILTTTLLIAAPSAARGHDPGACRPDDQRIPVRADFFLDACFDGTYLVLVNRTSLPITLVTTGDVHAGLKTPSTLGASIASIVADRWDPRLLTPGYQMVLPIGSAGGQVRLTYNDSTGQQYVIAQRVAALAPSAAGVPDLVSTFTSHVSSAYTDLRRCRAAHSNFLQQSWCATVFAADVESSVQTLVQQGVLTVTKVKALVSGLLAVVGASSDLADLHQDLDLFHRSRQTVDVPSGISNVRPPHPTVSSTAPATAGAGSSGTVPTLRVAGTCTSSGGTLTGSSSGFTPGGSATIRAWRPDGSAYPGITGTSRVRSDGTIRWSWPCAGDPPGSYTTEVTDTSTGRSTGRVLFTIGNPPAVTPPTDPPTTPPATSAPSGRLETAGVTSHTWTNYTNAGGSAGPVIPQGSTVSIACRLTGFRVANGNTWWYRVASPPWNNVYYVSADPFYNNGQTSGSVHGTPWVDEAVPLC